MKSRRRIAFPKGLGPRQLHGLLQQEFATGEMGLGGQFARQQFFDAHVRFCPKADSRPQFSLAEQSVELIVQPDASSDFRVALPAAFIYFRWRPQFRRS